jgi:hypothetical protein
MFYVIHEVETGAFVAVATDVSTLPASLAAVPYEARPDFTTHRWDAAQRLMVPRTASVISRQTFMDRLGDAAVAAVCAATKGTDATAAALMAWVLRFLVVQDIDVADSRTIAGVDALIAAGMLPVDRRDIVLALP